MPNEQEINFDDLDNLDGLDRRPARPVTTTPSPIQQVVQPDLTQREQGDNFRAPNQRGCWSAKIPDVNPQDMGKNEILQRQKKQETEEDRLVKYAEANPTSIDVFDTVVQELSREISSLLFDRKQAELKGDLETIAHISSRRVTALKSLAEAWVAKRKLILDESMDLKSERFQAVVEYLIEIFRDTMKEVGVDTPVIVEVFERLMANLDGWEEKAKERALAIEVKTTKEQKTRKKAERNA